MKEKELKTLVEYSEALDNLAKTKSTDVFRNRDHQHAAILLSKILRYSKNSFILFDDDLKGDIVKHDEVESFRNAVINFISRGGNIKIVISDKDANDDLAFREFLFILTELFPEQVELKLAKPEFKASMKEIFGEKVNFAVGDTNKFRLETFENNSKENKTRKAMGSFNDELMASTLFDAFHTNYESYCMEYTQ
ncbi:hypothetical protein N1F78_11635 [Seonamhaeicola sp. MEBiC1930]|uniref:hypothetical protein n=1 Tax=Seonamhaeicola sp. MEBiC01930 TaxID=2976768 RepID=UPI0032547308